MEHKCYNERCGVITTKPKYCSQRCAVSQTNRERGRAFRAANPNPKRKYKAKKCIKAKCENMATGPWAKYCDDHKEVRKEYKKRRHMHTRIKGLKRKRGYTKHGYMFLSRYLRGMAKNEFGYLRQYPCARCGYDKNCELCHIKEIKEFTENDKIKVINARENLVQLCRNCHWEMDNGYFELEYDDNLQITITETPDKGRLQTVKAQWQGVDIDDDTDED